MSDEELCLFSSMYDSCFNGLVCILNLISLPNRWLSFLYIYSIFLCTIGQRVNKLYTIIIHSIIIYVSNSNCF